MRQKASKETCPAPPGENHQGADGVSQSLWCKPISNCQDQMEKEDWEEEKEGEKEEEGGGGEEEEEEKGIAVHNKQPKLPTSLEVGR